MRFNISWLISFSVLIFFDYIQLLYKMIVLLDQNKDKSCKEVTFSFSLRLNWSKTLLPHSPLPGINPNFSFPLRNKGWFLLYPSEKITRWNGANWLTTPQKICHPWEGGGGGEGVWILNGMAPRKKGVFSRLAYARTLWVSLLMLLRMF